MLRFTSISSSVKLVVVIFFMLVVMQAYGQPNPIFNYQIGTIIHREQYSGNGKLESRTVEKITRCDTTSEGLLYAMDITKYSASGKAISNDKGTLRCANGNILIDMKSIYYMRDNKAYKWNTITEDLIIPSTMRDGETLPDAQVVCVVIKEPRIKVGSAGDSFKSDIGARVIYAIRNRGVTNDTLTTFLGNVPVFKVTSDVVNESEVGYGYEVNLVTREWYYPGIGLVRSEVVNKKGKVISYAVMTKREP